MTTGTNVNRRFNLSTEYSQISGELGFVEGTNRKILNMWATVDMCMKNAI